MNITKKFEVGKTYAHKSIDDMNTVYLHTIKILSRTHCTIKVEVDGGVRTLRILKGISEKYGVEWVAPWGQYSMCWYIDANDELVEAA